jgi:ABC-2 type transport system ATP-binding protein
MLDEPANGVDPAGLRFLRELIRRLADDGVTVFLSSHLLAEVQAVCNRVAVINAGRIVYEGSLSDLESSTGSQYRLHATDPGRAAAVVRQLEHVRDLRVVDGELEFVLVDEQDSVVLTRALADAGLGIVALTREQPTLEGLFFQLTEPDAVPAGSLSEVAR